jgi:hypothetical protein
MKSKSNFSIGSLDSEVSPSDNGKVLGASKEAGNLTKVSTLLSLKDDGLRHRKLDEQKKILLEAHLEDSLQETYLGRQRCDSMVSEPVRETGRSREQRTLSKIEEPQKTSRVEEQ